MDSRMMAQSSMGFQHNDIDIFYQEIDNGVF